jgi:hypothetical protein
VCCSGIKNFNSLPWDIKTYIDNPRTMKKALKKFLFTNSFYSLIMMAIIIIIIIIISFNL